MWGCRPLRAGRLGTRAAVRRTFALPLANAHVDQVIADQQKLVAAASLRIGVLADAA